MTTQTNQLKTENNHLTTRLLTVAQFVEEHKFATHGGIRHVLFNASTNGLAKSKAIKRLGKRILIDELAFLAWINDMDGGNN
jgi:hypothetical protein